MTSLMEMVLCAISPGSCCLCKYRPPYGDRKETNTGNQGWDECRSCASDKIVRGSVWGAFESEGMEFTCEITCMFSCHDGYILYSFRHLNTSEAGRRGG
jgi:hypothetical protein